MKNKIGMAKVMLTENVRTFSKLLKVYNTNPKLTINCLYTGEYFSTQIQYYLNYVLLKRNIFIFSGFQILYSKKDEANESPRMREFKKKLRERTPIGSLSNFKEFLTKL